MTTSANGHSRLAGSTWWRREAAGSWAIDVPLPERRTAAALNALAERMTNAFLDAFGGLCRAVDVHYDAAAAGGGSPEEAMTARFAGARDERQWRSLLVGHADAYFSRLVLVCDTEVVIPDGEGVRLVWVDESARFSFEYALEYDAGERLEAALRRWEALAGAPIGDWESRWYRSQIERYGFRPGRDRRDA